MTDKEKREVILDFLETYEDGGYAEFRGCGDFHLWVDEYIKNKNDAKAQTN